MYFGGVPSTGKSLYPRRTEQISSADFIGCVKSLTVNGHERRLFTDSFNATGIRDTCNQECIDLNFFLRCAILNKKDGVFEFLPRFEIGCLKKYKKLL